MVKLPYRKSLLIDTFFYFFDFWSILLSFILRYTIFSIYCLRISHTCQSVYFIRLFLNVSLYYPFYFHLTFSCDSTHVFFEYFISFAFYFHFYSNLLFINSIPVSIHMVFDLSNSSNFYFLIFVLNFISF